MCKMRDYNTMEFHRHTVQTRYATVIYLTLLIIRLMMLSCFSTKKIPLKELYCNYIIMGKKSRYRVFS